MKGVNQTRPLARLMLGASLLGLAMPAWAAEAADEASAGKLDEIVVTAQKREQNLQVVPIAISAIGAEKVEKLAIRDAKDLSGLAPNVTIVQGTTNANAAVISIRGIPTSAQETFGLDTANALYVDGIYIARSGGSALDVSEIARVEVLRGPQGTLFGRNTTGGAIAFISREPSKTFKLSGEAGYGNYNAFNGRISLDPGEIVGIASSFSYSHRQRNGVVDNILQPDKGMDPGGRQTDAFRAALKTDIGGTGTVQYIFDWSRTRASPINFQLTNTADGTVRQPVVVGGVPVTTTQQAPVQQYLAGVTYLNSACAALAAPTRVWRKQVCNDVLSWSVDKAWGHNVQITNDFGPFKFKSTTGYRRWTNDSATDLDGLGAFRGPAFTRSTVLNGFPATVLQGMGLPAATARFPARPPVPTGQQNLFDTSNTPRHRQFREEVEFSGDSDTLDWVVGAFYFWEKGSEKNPQNSGFILDTNSALFGDAAFVGLLTGFGYSPAAAAQFAPLLAPSFRSTNPARFRMAQTLSMLQYTAAAESTALYAQATYYPGGRDSGLRLTVGGRYTWDKKSMMRFQNGAAPLTTPDQGQASFNKFTWNLMLGYDITQGTNVYARVATGYRAGGFNAQDPATGGVLPSFKPESLTSYELGLKSELFDRRVRFNLAGYYNEYKDLAIAVPVTNAPAGTFATSVTNAGKVTYTGFEAELMAVLNDYINIEGNVGYVDIKYKTFLAGLPTTAGLPLVNIAGFATPGYTSPFTANAAINVAVPVGTDGMRVTGRASYTYEDPKYSFSNIITSPYNEILRSDAINRVDAQIALERIPLGGGTADIRVWGKNLTNQHALVRAIDFGQLGYGGGYYADPATYGVTVAVKF